MAEYKRIGIDTSKAVFTLHGAGRRQQAVERTHSKTDKMCRYVLDVLLCD